MESTFDAIIEYFEDGELDKAIREMNALGMENFDKFIVYSRDCLSDSEILEIFITYFRIEGFKKK